MGDENDLARLQLALERLSHGVAGQESQPMQVLRSVLSNAPDFIAIIAPDGRFLFLNRTRTGVTLESVLGTSVYDWLAPGQREPYRACVERVTKSGEAAAIETDVRFSDGRMASFETRMSPIHEGERMIALTVIATDISARRSATVALQESEAKLRMAADAAGIGLWSWDIRTDTVAWEDSLRAIFGLGPGEAPHGREGYLAMVHPDDRKRVAENIVGGVATGRWEDEYRVVRRDGAIRWVTSKGTVLPDAQGAPERVVGAVIDVTDRRQHEEQLRQAQKLEAIGQLTAGIAHNFNNMLMGVLPNLQLALPKAPPEIVPLLRDAEQSAGRAADLVRQLMTAAGQNHPAKRTVAPIAQLLERTVQMCRTTFDRRISFRAEYDRAARARVDPVELEQALLNVLINARDALEEGDVKAPSISVDVSAVAAGSAEIVAPLDATRDHVRIRVRDNGVGMDEKTLLRIYEPFFTTKEVGRGTGLGLATTRAILREHGGWVSCESVKGSGTTFSFYLPSENVTASAERAQNVGATPRGSEMVLIVDDEPAIRNVVGIMLREAGYVAMVAGSGHAAVDLLADEQTASKVRVILLDVSMPGMPRRELRNRLREIAPRAAVVYFTGYPFDAAGSDDAVLEKPASRDQLLGAIRTALDRRSLS